MSTHALDMWTFHWSQVLQQSVEDRIEGYKGFKRSKAETVEEAAIRLASAMTIVILHQDYNLAFTDLQTKRIFDALLLRPHAVERRCPDFEALSNIHFQNQTEYVFSIMNEENIHQRK